MIIKQMMALGFSEYESKSYRALLKHNPATAYETAKNAGIPSSKIYGVIDKLNDQGIVSEIRENGKKRYIPLDPESLLSNIKRETEQNLTALSKSIEKEKINKLPSFIWNIKEYDQFIEKAEELIGNSRENILLSLYSEEFERLYPLLKDKETEGVKIAVIHFGDCKKEIGKTFNHPIADTLSYEKGGRSFVLVTDGTDALMSTVTKNLTLEGGYSSGIGFVTLAEDYIKHDIYIMKIIKRFNNELVEKFGKGYSKLRDIFTDEEI